MQYKVFEFPPGPSSHFLSLMKVGDPWRPDTTCFSLTLLAASRQCPSRHAPLQPHRLPRDSSSIPPLGAPFPVLLGSMLITPHIATAGEATQSDRFLIPLFPRWRLGNGVLPATALGYLSRPDSVCSVALVPHAAVWIWFSHMWGLNLGWRPKY